MLLLTRDYIKNSAYPTGRPYRITVTLSTTANYPEHKQFRYYIYCLGNVLKCHMTNNLIFTLESNTAPTKSHQHTITRTLIV